MSDSRLNNTMEICDLELELAVEISVAQHGLSIINTLGLDMRYDNFTLFPSPSIRTLCSVSIQEKNSKVAEALVCVWDSVKSPLALGCPGYHRRQSSTACFVMFPLHWLELRLNNRAGF